MVEVLVDVNLVLLLLLLQLEFLLELVRFYSLKIIYQSLHFLPVKSIWTLTWLFKALYLNFLPFSRNNATFFAFFKRHEVHEGLLKTCDVIIGLSNWQGNASDLRDLLKPCLAKEEVLFQVANKVSEHELKLENLVDADVVLPENVDLAIEVGTSEPHLHHRSDQSGLQHLLLQFEHKLLLVVVLFMDNRKPEFRLVSLVFVCLDEVVGLDEARQFAQVLVPNQLVEDLVGGLDDDLFHQHGILVQFLQLVGVCQVNVNVFFHFLDDQVGVLVTHIREFQTLLEIELLLDCFGSFQIVEIFVL